MFSDEKRGNPLYSDQIPSFFLAVYAKFEKSYFQILLKKRRNQQIRGKL
jgi:hypothetical protein